MKEEKMSRENSYLAIGIAGSPRRRGNSTSLLRAYLDGTSQVGFETKIIYLNNLIYKGCQGCDRCVRGKACGIQDDLSTVFPLLRKADIWAMASPIYYDGVSGQLKTFFDRLRFTTHDPFKLEGPRRGIVIVTYEDDPREYYAEVAAHLAEYFNWKNRGDFQKVRVISESNLGPVNAWKERPDLQVKLRNLGREQANELIKSK
jgi:multimeric flavodoxin WrbA